MSENKAAELYAKQSEIPLLNKAKGVANPVMGYAIVDGVLSAYIFDGERHEGWADSPVKAVDSEIAGADQGDGIKVSNKARILADEANIDLSSLTGSGVGGNITLKDVKEAVKASVSEGDQE